MFKGSFNRVRLFIGRKKEHVKAETIGKDICKHMMYLFPFKKCFIVFHPKGYWKGESCSFDCITSFQFHFVRFFTKIVDDIEAQWLCLTTDKPDNSTFFEAIEECAEDYTQQDCEETVESYNYKRILRMPQNTQFNLIFGVLCNGLYKVPKGTEMYVCEARFK